MNHFSYWHILAQGFKKKKISLIALVILLLFFLVGLYAPLFTSSKPLLVAWNGEYYSPLLRYVFYRGFYTKPIDLFYNLLMFTLPLSFLGILVFRRKIRQIFLIVMALFQCLAFVVIARGWVKDPASNSRLDQKRHKMLETNKIHREDPLLQPFLFQPTWDFDLKYKSTYRKLNSLLRYQQQKSQHQKIKTYQKALDAKAPTLYAVAKWNRNKAQQDLEKIIQEKKVEYSEQLNLLPQLIEAYLPYSHSYIIAKSEADDEANKHILEQSQDVRNALIRARAKIEAYKQALNRYIYLQEREQWLQEQSEHLHVIIPPLLRDFHWEDDAGGSQSLNKLLPWWELTRVNRKDLVASLLFGIRISLVVGVSAVILSLLIGIPLGMFAGYFSGKMDLLICRFIEVWEAMPTFFMLLLVIAIMQNNSIFLIMGVLGIFGWTGFGRFIRAEVLKQRNFPYILACKNFGYSNLRIMFSHILPNAIAPILTLIPFSMMAAITSEAGISFLGLGEEGSTSWGVLMDEGRAAFPGESYLLWPPAILLTVLLICIALVGDALRDALDPKMR